MSPATIGALVVAAAMGLVVLFVLPKRADLVWQAKQRRKSAALWRQVAERLGLKKVVAEPERPPEIKAVFEGTWDDTPLRIELRERPTFFVGTVVVAVPDALRLVPREEGSTERLGIAAFLEAVAVLSVGTAENAGLPGETAGLPGETAGLPGQTAGLPVAWIGALTTEVRTLLLELCMKRDVVIEDGTMRVRTTILDSDAARIARALEVTAEVARRLAAGVAATPEERFATACQMPLGDRARMLQLLAEAADHRPLVEALEESDDPYTRLAWAMARRDLQWLRTTEMPNAWLVEAVRWLVAVEPASVVVRSRKQGLDELVDRVVAQSNAARSCTARSDERVDPRSEVEAEAALVSFTEAIARSHQALEDPDVRAAALHVLAALHDRTT